MQPQTSWEKVNKWYNKEVSVDGSYYHSNLVIPNSLRLLDLKKDSKLLDLACGQGILSRHLQNTVMYKGIDLAPSLVEFAQAHNQNKNFTFEVADITKPIKTDSDYTHSTCILALQNLANLNGFFTNTHKSLIKGGKLLLVLNHPHYRIPKMSSWGVDESGRVQFRRIDAYLSPLEIPILHEPSKGPKSEVTWSFHYPLQTISAELRKAGFGIEIIEEWVSPKVSVGKNANRENVSRNEIPLFMAILAFKL